jgi:hypothetical protein
MHEADQTFDFIACGSGTSGSVTGDPARETAHGIIPVTQDSSASALGSAASDAFERSGVPRYKSLNGSLMEESIGHSDSERTVVDGQRVSVFTAHLQGYLAAPNLTILTETLVQSVAIEGNRATGVSVIQNGKSRQFKARKALLAWAVLLASAASLSGRANADPALLTVTSADPDGAVAASASSATDLNIAVAQSDPNVSLPDPGDVASKETTATDGIADRDAGITDEMTSAPVGQFTAVVQPFAPVAGAAPIRNSGIDNFQPAIAGTATFAPNAPGSTHQSLLAGISFSFGAELYSFDTDPVSVAPEVPTSTSVVPEPSNWAMTIMGLIGVGSVPYILASALLPQPDRSALTVQSN